MKDLFQAAMIGALTFGAVACASKGAAPAAVSPTLDWAAHGYLSPGGEGGSEFIGAYASEAACRAAVDNWMSRQVVGNPVSGECLPVDRR